MYKTRLRQEDSEFKVSLNSQYVLLHNTTVSKPKPANQKPKYRFE